MATKIKATRIRLLFHAATCILKVQSASLVDPNTSASQTHFIHFSNNHTHFLDKYIMS